MHPAAFQWAKLHVPELPRSVVEIGGMDVNCSLRNFYTWSEYLCVDIAAGPGVDVVAPFAVWAAGQPEASRDLVVSFEVFEHTPTWPDIARQACRLLEPGGRFIGTCATGQRPGHSAYGLPELPADEFYRNVPAGELADHLLDVGFSDVTVNVTRSNMDLRWVATL